MKRLLATLLLIAACSSETTQTTETSATTKAATPPPTAEQAREIVASAPELAEYEFTNAAISIPVSAANMSEPIRKNAQELAAAGWIEFNGKEVWLTEKSRGDKRFLLRDNGILDIVPLAKKELVSIDAVRANPDGSPAIDFTWRWVPNDIATALKTGPTAERYATEQHATATLIWDGTSWSVLQITPR